VDRRTEWPERIKDKGGLRDQFMHIIDVVPTILEVTGIPAPETVDGIEQARIEGTSFAYTFDEANAKEPSRHKTQYFEMMGQWTLYHEGWLLSTKVIRASWEAFGEDPAMGRELRHRFRHADRRERCRRIGDSTASQQVWRRRPGGVDTGPSAWRRLYAAPESPNYTRLR